MKKVLIHQHPQFAYTARILAIESQQNIGQYYHLFGPCLIQGLLDHYCNYFLSAIIQHLPNSHFVVVPPQEVKKYAAQTIHAPFDSPNKVSGLDLSPLIRQAHQSVEDSLLRGLLWGAKIGFYYDNRFYSEGSKLLDVRLSIYQYLYNYYGSVLDQIEPCKVYISHQSYDVYFALYHAARDRGVDVSIVHGGHQSMYAIHNGDHMGIGKDAMLRSQLSSGNIMRYECTGSPSLSKPSSRQYCMLSGSLSDLFNDASLFGNSSKRLYVLCLPVFSELNVEIFNGDRPFIDRLSWLKATIIALSRLTDNSFLIIRIHPNSNSYREVYWLKKTLIQLLRDFPISNTFISSSNFEFTHIVQTYDFNISRAIYILYQGSLSVELPQYGIKPICGITPLATEHMCITPQSVDQYQSILANCENINLCASQTAMQEAASLVAFDNYLCRGSSSDPYMTELDGIYHFSNIKTPPDLIPQSMELLDSLSLIKYATQNFTTYALTTT